MHIALFHGFELTGSGSNEYTRYLSRALARRGHDVHVLCREPHPERVAHVARAFSWSLSPPERRALFARRVEDGGVTVHQLPHGPVRPVYLTDKERPGNVRSFEALTDDELARYHEDNVLVVGRVLETIDVDIVHANHLVWQPSVLAKLPYPFVVFPHGSAIEYTVRRDTRYRAPAREALLAARGVISGNHEVLDRILELFPDDRDTLIEKSAIVGVGVDTSLFQPVERSQRRATVSRVDGTRGGKSRAQSEELDRRLARGDYDALTAYRGAYDQAEPDEDLLEKLDRIPWEEGRVLVFVGALTVGKGIQTLLCALPEIVRRRDDVHLVLVGSGAYREVLEGLTFALANGDQALFDYLVRHGFDLDRSELTGGWEGLGGAVPHAPGLDERVHFLGRLPHRLLRFVGPCADLAVFPSVVPEAYPLVLMESLANGVLPLVSDFSGFADGLDHLSTLIGDELVDRLRLPYAAAERLPGLVSRVCSNLDQPPDADTLRRLREVAVEHFDWNVRAREMEAAYRRFATS